MKKKRALVIGGGAYYSAYDAGVACALCRELGGDYFDAAYGSSVGTYIATYCVANQPDAIEHVWRNCVDGKKFFDYTNPLRNRRILNLEYLNSLCPRLDLDTVMERTSLYYTLTQYPTGKVVYVKPRRDTVFQLMSASSAIPLLHPPITVGGIAYVDGGLSDPLPFSKARADGYSDITVIYNEPEECPTEDPYDTVSRILALCLPREIGRLIKTRAARSEQLERRLATEKNLKVIRPKTRLPLTSVFDSNKQRINLSFDRGIADAKEFLKAYA